MSLHLESSWSRDRRGGKPWLGRITILSVTFTTSRPWGRWRRKVYPAMIGRTQQHAEPPATGGRDAVE